MTDEGTALWGVPPSWIWTQAGTIAKIVGGGTPSTSDPKNFDGGAIAWITPADLSGYKRKLIWRGRRNITEGGYRACAARLMPPGTVLFSSRAPIGHVAIAANEVCTNQGFKSFVLRQGLVPDFVYYYLQRAKPIAESMASGTTFAELSGRRTSALPFPVPPSNEQTRIADKLDELLTDLDAGVAALERVRRNLERYRASVLKAAVEGRLTEEWRREHPDVEPASELLKRILVERRRKWAEAEEARYAAKGKKPPKGWKDRYKEPAAPDTSALPDLPDGWVWATVDALLVASLCNGISVKGSDSPPGVPALKLNAMTDTGFDYNAIRYIPIDEGTSRALAVQENDFFVSRGNGSIRLVGRGTLAQKPPFLVVFPDLMIRARLSDAILHTRWLPSIWPSRLVRRQIEKRVKTTAGIWKIAQPQVASITVPLPPNAEQEAIGARLDKAMSVVAASDGIVRSGLKRSSRLRQSILKAAFEGRLVPQDPDDEPADKLLERIRACLRAGGSTHRQAAKAAEKPVKKRRKAKTKKKGRRR